VFRRGVKSRVANDAGTAAEHGVDDTAQNAAIAATGMNVVLLHERAV
jgi:hypothetical protein